MRLTLLTLVMLSVATGAAAHHSPALYDFQKTITVDGSVAKYEWSNPHVYIFIRSTTNADDRLWEVEAGSPTMMERTGWFKDSLRVNDRVVIQVNPARNPARRVALLRSLQKADGSFAYRLGNFTPAVLPNPVAASSLTGNWLPTTQEFMRFVGSPAEWPLTDKGRAATTRHTDSKNGVQNCVSLSAPFLMAWNDLKQIEVGDRTTLIRAALIDNVERVIHMNADSHAGAKPTNQGHSIGRFEGGALVVDTTHFAPHASGIRNGVPSGRGKHLVERFQLSPDRTRLTYSFELADPEYLAKPVTGSVEWVHRPDLTYIGYMCDRGMAGRFLAK
jgi:hypothetical protein